jgi:hypothetical protein
MVKSKKLWLVLGVMVMAAMLVASCGPAPTPTPVPVPTPVPTKPAATAAPVGEAALTVTGKVDKELKLTLADLQAVQVEIKAEHPKQGMQTYKGARLNDLLKNAGLKADAKSIVLVASDGYTAEVSLADLQKCTDCLAAIGSDSKLSAAMPGMASNIWTKGLIKIEVK